MQPFKTLILKNGLELTFIDQSNRYFGDYHRLTVQIQMVFELSNLVPDEADDPFWTQVCEHIGPSFQQVRKLERMGVPSAELDSVRSRMVTDFLEVNLPYLEHAGYLRSMAKAELTKKPVRPPYGR